MSPQDLIQLLRRYWLFTVAMMLLGVIAAIGATLLVTPLYTSTARDFVAVSSPSASVLDLSQGGSFAEKAVESYAEVATSPRVLDPVIDELRLGTTADRLARTIDVQTSSNSVVMAISATDSSPTRAASIANAVSSHLATVVSELNQSSKGSASVTINSIASATPAESPSSPNPIVDAVVGGIVGVLVALILTGLRRVLVNKVERSDELAALMGAPVVGEVVRDRSVAHEPLRVLIEPLSGFAESIRDLRTNLQYLTTAEGAQSIVITSSGPAEGKTTTAANLALSLAEAQTVVLVDADLRKPRVANVLGIDGGVGLTDVLVGRATLAEAVQIVGANGLAVLPAGGHPPNASELLQSDAMRKLLTELSEQYSTVLFDTPPSGLLSDARVLARECSGALVIAALRRSKRPQLRATATALQRAGAKTLGVVATFVPSSNSAYYELEAAEGQPTRSRLRARKRFGSAGAAGQAS